MNFKVVTSLQFELTYQFTTGQLNKAFYDTYLFDPEGAIKRMKRSGGDNSKKGSLGTPINNFMSSRKFGRPSRNFRWHSP